MPILGFGRSDEDIGIKITTKADLKGVNQADRAIGGLGKNVGTLGFKSVAMGNILAMVVERVATSVAKFGADALATTSNFEQSRIAFDTMLGSADEARKLMQKISDFALGTPFELPEVVEGSKRLLAYGNTAEEIIPLMNDLGNIASGVGKNKLPFLITAMGQVKAKTELAGEELKQLTETGVPIIEELAKVTGYSTAQITDDTKNLGISYDEVRTAIGNLAGDGGKFDNLMQRQSKTFGGVVSNIKDGMGKIQRATMGMSESGEIIEGGFFSIIKKGADESMVGVQALADKIQENMPAIVAEFSKASEKVYEFGRQAAEYLGPKLKQLWHVFEEDLLPTLKELWHEVLEPILPVIGVAFVFALGLLIDAFSLLIKVITPVQTAINRVAGAAIDGADDLVFLANAVWNKIKPAFDWLGEKIRWLRDKFKGLEPSIKTALSGLAETILLPFQPLVTAIGWVQTLIEKFRILRNEQPKKSPGGLNILTHGPGLTTLTNGRQYARGGRPFKGVANLVGEEGPELFIPRQAGTIVPARQTRNMLNGSGGSVNNTRTVTIQNVMLGSADAAREFFAQLDNDTLLSSNGMTPIRGAV